MYLKKLGFEKGIESVNTIQQSNEACKSMPWDEIATKFDRTVRKPKDIRKRWVSSLDPNLRKGKWTSEEDDLLMKSFEKWGPHWLKVSTEIPGRTEDQCAKRYIEVLDPSTKDRLRDWSLQEDLALISKVKIYGTSWRRISLEMESRPSLTCRNRWRKIITMIMRGKASEEITKAVQETSQTEQVQSLDELRESLRTKLEEMKEESPQLDETQASDEEQLENQREVKLDSPMGEPLAAQNPPAPFITSNMTGTYEKPSIQRDERLQEQGQIRTQANGKLRPQSSTLDWRFSLDDRSGNPLTEGIISNSDLVREIIEEAKKNDLTISIHQHIHNHYGTTPFSTNPQNQSLSGEILSQLSPFAFADDRNTKSANSRPFETEFLGRSPNYVGLALDTQSDPVTQNRGLAGGYSSIPIYTQKPGPTSSLGSRSTPGAELEEIPPHRQYHFNYLPPTVKPQLGSSDSIRTPEVGRVPNRSPVAQSRRKRRKKGKDDSSEEGHTPNVSYGSTGTTPKNHGVSPSTEKNPKQSTNLTPGGASTVGEEEGLDFWESLRSLAQVPSNQSHKNAHDGPLDEYDYLYNFYEDQVEVSRPDHPPSTKMTATQSVYDRNKNSRSGGNFSNPDLIHKGLPYNPS